MNPVLDSNQMIKFMHHIEGFDRVLHVAHHEWHGIRHATAYAPGHKLLIPADSPLDRAQLSGIAGEIEKHGFDHIVFQGYSENADQLLLHLKSLFGSDIFCFVITHVTTSQFDNHFETIMQARLFMRKRYGLLTAIGSVKPDFSKTFEDYWSGTIINFAPNIPEGSFIRQPDTGDVYIPLDAGWRKNMYTNILGACMAPNVARVKTANFPNGLESIFNLNKLRLVGYLRGNQLMKEMACSSLVLLATFAECQPMTQLEAMAVGTPAMTGPLRLHDFDDDPLLQLCTTDKLDNPAQLAVDVKQLVEAVTSNPTGMKEMISFHLDRRHNTAIERYGEFLGL